MSGALLFPCGFAPTRKPPVARSPCSSPLPRSVTGREEVVSHGRVQLRKCKCNILLQLQKHQNKASAKTGT